MMESPEVTAKYQSKQELQPRTPLQDDRSGPDNTTGESRLYSVDDQRVQCNVRPIPPPITQRHKLIRTIYQVNLMLAKSAKLPFSVNDRRL